MTYSCLRQGPRADVPDFSGRAFMILPFSSNVSYPVFEEGSKDTEPTKASKSALPFVPLR